MARPALIVGVGGTGQWTLVYTKKNLLEASDTGTVPDQVRLLSIDAHRTPGEGHAGGAAGQNGSAGPAEGEIRLGDIVLDPLREYCGLTGDLEPLVKEISRAPDGDALAHAASWFPARYILNAKVNLNVEKGCGQSRLLGRLAFYRWRQRIGDAITQALKHFTAERTRFTQEDRFEVMLVCSWAGGTGAGMFLDLAYLLRERVGETIGENYFMRGFFVLPHSTMAIEGGADAAMARGFAAWREFDRFMRAGEIGAGFGTPIRYLSGRDTPVTRRPFDAAYLVSPERPVNSLVHMRPEDALYPSVAEAIVAILDEKLGSHYTSVVEANLLPVYLDPSNTGKAFYSSIGTYSYNVPRHYISEQYKFGLAIDFARDFFAIDDRDAPPLALETDADKTAGRGDHGRGVALQRAFLAEPALQCDGLAAPNTGFFPWVAQTLDRLDQGTPRQGMVTVAAAPASTGGNLHPWEGPFTMAVGDADFTRRAQAAAMTKALLGLKQYYGDHGQWDPDLTFHPRDVAPLLPAKFEEREATLIGPIGQSEKLGLNLLGQYPKTLQSLEETHIAVYEQRLRVKVHELLNGDDGVRGSDAYAARSGRFGRTHSFLEGMTERWNTFIQFCMETQQRRGMSATNTLQADRPKRTQDMQTRAQETSKFGREVPGKEELGRPTRKAYEAVDEYTDYWQRYLNTRTGDVVVWRVLQTAIRCQQITAQMRDLLDRVARFYVTSRDSVYAALLEEQGKLRIGAQDDKALESVIRNFIPQSYAHFTARHQARKDEAIKDLCGQVRWQLERDPTGAWNLVLQVRESPDTAEFQTVRTAELREGQPPTTDAVGALRRMTAMHVLDVQPFRPVAPIVRQELTAAQVQHDIAHKGEPLYVPTQLGDVEASRQTHYVRVSRDDDPGSLAWLQGIADAIHSVNPQVRVLQSPTTWDSTDPFRFTSIRTAEAIPSEGFDARVQFRNAYLAEVRQRLASTDPGAYDKSLVSAHLLHAFPAEVNAIQYEIKVAQQFGLAYQEFDPRIVALLERPRLLQLYLVARTIEMVREVDRRAPDDGAVQWAWVLDLAPPGEDLTHERLARPGTGQLRFLTPWRTPAQHTQYSDRELEDRAHQFVVGRRDARPESEVDLTIDPGQVHRALMQHFDEVQDDPTGLLREVIKEGFVQDWQNLPPSSHLQRMGYLAQVLLEEYLQEFRPSVIRR